MLRDTCLCRFTLLHQLLPRAAVVAVYLCAGNGRSQKPSLLDTSTWWCVDDHFLHDLPAVMDYVLAATGMQQLHYVGHSMVSLQLALGYASRADCMVLWTCCAACRWLKNWCCAVWHMPFTCLHSIPHSFLLYWIIPQLLCGVCISCLPFLPF